MYYGNITFKFFVLEICCTLICQLVIILQIIYTLLKSGSMIVIDKKFISQSTVWFNQFPRENSQIKGEYISINLFFS